MHGFSQRSQWYAIAVAIGAAIIWRLFAFDFFGVTPHVMLVAVLLVAFFVRRAVVFAWGIAGILLCTAYVPFFQFEYLLLVVVGIAGFIFARAVIFEHKLPLFIGTVAVAQVVWWIGIGYGTTIFTVPFVLEFLYNAIVASALFFIAVWLEETFS